MPHSSPIGRPGQTWWLASALTLAAIGLAACGDGDTGEESSDADGDAAVEEEVLIKTEVEIGSGDELTGSDISRGEVLDGSTLGDSSFCPDGTFDDAHSEDPDIGFVDRTFECPDGTLRVGFSPGQPTTPLIQSGPWKVVSGTGAFEGLEGDGQMKIKYEPHTQATEGRETFTGAVVP